MVAEALVEWTMMSAITTHAGRTTNLRGTGQSQEPGLAALTGLRENILIAPLDPRPLASPRTTNGRMVTQLTRGAVKSDNATVKDNHPITNGLNVVGQVGR